jgi:hypothetical protein
MASVGNQSPYHEPLTHLWQELPLILFDENFDACCQLLNIVFFEQSHVALNSILVINPFFLHHPAGGLISSNEH